MADEWTTAVTGGARGIGRAIARRLAADGAHVLVIDIDEGDDTVAAIEADGGSAEYVTADVTVEPEMEAALGGRSLDALVNNAAFFKPLLNDMKRFDQIDVAEWDRVLSVNVKGPFLASKHALSGLADGGGAVVNLSSNTVTSGVPGFLHYVTSKAAIVGMTRAMASEVGDVGVRVNAVMPGITASETVLEGYDRSFLEARRAEQAIERTIEPEDIADVVAFLAGEHSGMVTGQVLTVDGGYTYY